MEGAVWLGIFTLCFVLLDIYCAYKLIRYYRLKKHGVSTYASIVRLDKRPVRNGSAYYPVMEFTDEDGITYTVSTESGMSIKSRKYSVGKKLRLYYDRSMPERFIVEGNDLYSSIALSIFCLLFTFAFFMLFISVLV